MRVCLHILAFKTILLFSDSTCTITYIFNILNLMIFHFFTDRKGPTPKGKMYPKKPPKTLAQIISPLQARVHFLSHIISL